MKLSNPYNLPNSLGRLFTGRENLLEEIKRTLIRKKVGIICQYIFGLGGIGKTTIATEYARRSLQEKNYDLIIFLNASNQKILANEFKSLSLACGISQKCSKTYSPQDIVKFVYQKIYNTYKSILLIFDDVEDLDTIKGKNTEEKINYEPSEYLGAGIKLHWLITTRNQNLSSQFQKFKLEVFNLDESIWYIQNSLSLKKTIENKKKSITLAKTLSYFPLALSYATAYIEYNLPLCSIEKYITLINGKLQDQQNLLCANEGENHEKTVFTVWEVSVEKLRKTNLLAVEILNHCAFLASDPIPLELIKQLFPKIIETDFLEGIRGLRKYSFIDLSSEEDKYQTVILHSMLQKIVRLHLRSDNGKLSKVMLNFTNVQLYFDPSMIKILLLHAYKLLSNYYELLSNYDNNSRNYHVENVINTDVFLKLITNVFCSHLFYYGSMNLKERLILFENYEQFLNKEKNQSNLMHIYKVFAETMILTPNSFDAKKIFSFLKNAMNLAKQIKDERNCRDLEINEFLYKKLYEFIESKYNLWKKINIIYDLYSFILSHVYKKYRHDFANSSSKKDKSFYRYNCVIYAYLFTIIHKILSDVVLISSIFIIGTSGLLCFFYQISKLIVLISIIVSFVVYQENNKKARFFFKEVLELDLITLKSKISYQSLGWINVLGNKISKLLSYRLFNKFSKYIDKLPENYSKAVALFSLANFSFSLLKNKEQEEQLANKAKSLLSVEYEISFLEKFLKEIKDEYKKHEEEFVCTSSIQVSSCDSILSEDPYIDTPTCASTSDNNTISMFSKQQINPYQSLIIERLTGSEAVVQQSQPSKRRPR